MCVNSSPQITLTDFRRLLHQNYTNTDYNVQIVGKVATLDTEQLNFCSHARILASLAQLLVELNDSMLNARLCLAVILFITV